jgi:hypothetical protein
MRHRLYYLLPDMESARRALDDLLLNRIEERYIRFISRAPLPPDMPEANVLIKTDVIHGATSGLMVGAGLGVLLGSLLIFYFNVSQTVILPTTFIGALLGGWAASMAAAALPNSRLNAFYPEMDKGKLLLIIDVPARRVQQIEKMLAERHPEMEFNGEDPYIPAFP